MKQLATAAIALTLSSAAFAKDPDCSGPERWPASIVFVKLKNAGLLDANLFDLSKTTSRLVNSQRVGRDLYRQVHFVRYLKRSGQALEAMTVGEVSSVECSVSNVDVYLVAQKFGGYSDETGTPIAAELGPATAKPIGK